MTVFVGLGRDGEDAVSHPVAIDLPIRAFGANLRPEPVYAVTQNACAMMGFDAGGSSDSDGRVLQHHWRFAWAGEAFGDAVSGASLAQGFDRPGAYRGRLEVYDDSGLVGSGAAREFGFFVKAAPVAALSGPSVAAEGEAVSFDGSASTASAWTGENRIIRYHWRFGDGVELVQEEGDAEFGRPAHAYARHGTYTVELTVTDAPNNRCNTATTTRTINVNAPPVANAGGDVKVAQGETATFDAAASSDADGDPLSVSWDFGDGTSSQETRAEHEYATSGTYTVTLSVDDGKGASNSVTRVSREVFVNAAPSVEAVLIPDRLVVGVPGVFDARGATDEDGEVTVYEWQIAGGSANSKPSFRKSFETPGTYDVVLRVTDNSGLSNSTTVLTRKLVVVDTGNDAPIAMIDGSQDAFVGEVVTFSGRGSTDPDGSILAYHWDFGDGKTSTRLAPEHVYWKPGTYKVALQVTDDSDKANNIHETTLDVVVTHRPNSPPEVRVGGDRSAFVNEIIDFSAIGTTDDTNNLLVVEWDFGDGSKASGFTARHAYLEPGEYKVSVVVTDDSGLRNSSANMGFTVKVTHPFNEAPVLAFDNEYRLQVGVPHLFDATAAQDEEGFVSQFEWDFGDGTVSNRGKLEHSYAKAGTYFGKLTIKDDSGLESGTAKLPFTVFVDAVENRAPQADAGPDRKATVGVPVEFDGGGSSDDDGSLVKFDWDFGNGKTATGERRAVTYFKSGSYQVTLKVTDNSGQPNNTDTDTLLVDVSNAENQTPVAGIDSRVSAAIDEPISFSGAPSTDPDGNILAYVWDFGDGNTGSGRDVIHAFSKSGTYEVTLSVEDDSGLQNKFASATLNVFVNEPPVADAGEDQHVSASQVKFDASGSTDIDSNIIGYEWDFGDGETGIGRQIIHTYRTPGTYTARLKVTDDTGTIRNSDTDEVTVVVNAMPVADAGFDFTAAPGETVSFDGRRSIDPDGEIARYVWNFGDGSKAEGNVVDHVFEKPGRYDVELLVFDDSGHENAVDFSTIRVTVNEKPVAVAGADLSVAPGQAFRLSGKRSLDGDGEIVDWRWDVPSTEAVLSGQDVELSFADPGIFQVLLTVTDDSVASNRTAQDTVTVNVNHSPIADAGKDIFSGSLRVILDASGSTDPDNDGMSYAWNLGDGTSREGPVIEHTYESGGVYPVILTVNDGRGLENSISRDAVRVSVNRPPVAAAGDNRLACVGDVVVFDGSSSTDPDKGLLLYNWDFGDGNKSNIVNPTKIYSEAGNYPVMLEVTDESGLSNASHSDEVLVSILPAVRANAGPDLNVCAGEIVQFNGSASTDVDGLVNRYSWDFGDGLSGGGDRPTHIYRREGLYRVSLQVEGDNLGICSPTSTDELIVNVRDAPLALVSGPVKAAENQVVTFDGSGSSLKNGEITDYRWKLGDGTEAEGAQISHAFKEAGQYRVELHVNADGVEGGCSNTKVVHLITINAPPVAEIEALDEVEVGQPLKLSAANSSDPDGGVARYSWDFGGGEIAEGVEVRHIWRKPGRYELTLAVDDGTELPNSVTRKTFSVNVIDPPDVAIVADAVACTGEPVSFNLANLADEVDGKDLEWNFGDIKKAVGRSVTHKYTQAGRYTARTLVPVNRAGEITQTPLTHRIAINQPPNAIIDAARKTCPGIPHTFDAGASFDPDGEITSYTWDFGDGQNSSGPQVTHAFSRPGTYDVKLVVEDNSGSGCSRTEREFRLFVNSAPVADAGPDVDLKIGGAHDRVVLDAGRSVDQDGDTLEYFWSLSNGQELDGQKTSFVLVEEGVLTGELTVADPHDLQCSYATDTFSISAQERESSILHSN